MPSGARADGSVGLRVRDAAKVALRNVELQTTPLR
jgi:hypothetical protein